jgi:hypothetical protein
MTDAGGSGRRRSARRLSYVEQGIAVAEDVAIIDLVEAVVLPVITRSGTAVV